jgi:hypothetical protein
LNQATAAVSPIAVQAGCITVPASRAEGRAAVRNRHSIAAILVGLTSVLTVLVPHAASAATGPTSSRAILRAGVIVAGDLPSGWTKGPHPKKSDTSLRGIPSCKTVIAADAAAERSAPQARSATFSDPATGGKTTTAENTVFVFKDAAAASRFLAVYAANDASECLRASVARQIGSQATTTVSPIGDLGNLGDARVGDEIVVQGAGSNGQPISLFADVVFVRVGRAIIGFDFLNLNQRLPQGPSVVSAVVSRLA